MAQLGQDLKSMWKSYILNNFCLHNKLKLLSCFFQIIKASWLHNKCKAKRTMKEWCFLNAIWSKNAQNIWFSHRKNPGMIWDSWFFHIIKWSPLSVKASGTLGPWMDQARLWVPEAFYDHFPLGRRRACCYNQVYFSRAHSSLSVDIGTCEVSAQLDKWFSQKGSVMTQLTRIFTR